MKKIMILIIFMTLFLIGCSNVKTFEKSVSVLEIQGYELKTSENETFFNITNINRIVAEKEEDVLILASIYFCQSKEDAQALYKIINNLYMAFIYSSDIYGFNNSYSIYYGIIDSPQFYPEYDNIDWDLLNSLEGSVQTNIGSILFDNLEKGFTFPNLFIPSTYEEFQNNTSYYTPQCFIKGNNVYFGSSKILNLIVS